jgi:DHA3 family macrolide efflux protein-like MFS transporter
MWFTYARTGSSLEVAGIGVAFQLTYVVVGPLAGVWADRWDRRRTMIAADLTRAALLGGFALYTSLLGFSFPLALLTVCLETMAGRFFTPSRSAYLPTIVERDDLVTANGMMSGTQQAMGLGGQAVAGFVLTTAGAVSGFVIDAMSFAMSALALSLVRVQADNAPARSSPEEPPAPRSSFWRDLRGGWDVIAGTPVIRALALYAAVGNFDFAMIAPAMPEYVRSQLHTGAWAYGLVGSFQFGGGLLGVWWRAASPRGCVRAT